MLVNFFSFSIYFALIRCLARTFTKPPFPSPWYLHTYDDDFDKPRCFLMKDDDTMRMINLRPIPLHFHFIDDRPPCLFTRSTSVDFSSALASISSRLYASELRAGRGRISAGRESLRQVYHGHFEAASSFSPGAFLAALFLPTRFHSL